MRSDTGVEFLLDLKHARLLRQGEGLKLSNGKVIKVVSKNEPLFKITAQSTNHLTKLAWQLGNRHLAAQINEDSIIIRRDHVIKDMIQKLGGTVSEIQAPFEPEGGAYNHKHKHSS